MSHEPHPRPRYLLRFLRSTETLFRIWLWCIGIGFCLAVIGIAPSVIGVVALVGPLWVIIFVLIFWGRMLDDMIQPRSDLDEGPR